MCLLQEQQQALLYQLMQQQHQQHDLQQLSSTQLPINNLLPAAQGAIAANPFLALHNDNSSQKAAVSNITHLTKQFFYYYFLNFSSSLISTHSSVIGSEMTHSYSSSYLFCSLLSCRGWVRKL